MTDYCNLAAKYVPDPTTFDIGAMTAIQTAGNAAMTWGNSSIAAYFATGSVLSPSTWLYCPFPAYDGGACPTFTAGATMEIPKNANNAAGAFSLMSWITSPRMQAIFFQEGNGTIRSSVLDNPAVKNSTDPYVQILRQSIAWTGPPAAQPVCTPGATQVYGPIGINMPGTTTLAANIGNEVAKVVAGQETAAVACANLDASTTALLKSNGFANKYTYPFGAQ